MSLALQSHHLPTSNSNSNHPVTTATSAAAAAAGSIKTGSGVTTMAAKKRYGAESQNKGVLKERERNGGMVVGKLLGDRSGGELEQNNYSTSKSVGIHSWNFKRNHKDQKVSSLFTKTRNAPSANTLEQDEVLIPNSESSSSQGQDEGNLNYEFRKQVGQQQASGSHGGKSPSYQFQTQTNFMHSRKKKQAHQQLQQQQQQQRTDRSIGSNQIHNSRTTKSQNRINISSITQQQFPAVFQLSSASEAPTADRIHGKISFQGKPAGQVTPEEGLELQGRYGTQGIRRQTSKSILKDELDSNCNIKQFSVDKLTPGSIHLQQLTQIARETHNNSPFCIADHQFDKVSGNTASTQLRKGKSVTNNRLTVMKNQHNIKQGNAFFNHIAKSKSRDLDQLADDDNQKMQISITVQNNSSINKNLYQTGHIVVGKAEQVPIAQLLKQGGLYKQSENQNSFRKTIQQQSQFALGGDISPPLQNAVQMNSEEKPNISTFKNAHFQVKNGSLGFGIIKNCQGNQKKSALLNKTLQSRKIAEHDQSKSPVSLSQGILFRPTTQETLAAQSASTKHPQAVLPSHFSSVQAAPVTTQGPEALSQPHPLKDPFNPQSASSSLIQTHSVSQPLSQHPGASNPRAITAGAVNRTKMLPITKPKKDSVSISKTGKDVIENTSDGVLVKQNEPNDYQNQQNLDKQPKVLDCNQSNQQTAPKDSLLKMNLIKKIQYENGYDSDILKTNYRQWPTQKINTNAELRNLNSLKPVNKATQLGQKSNKTSVKQLREKENNIGQKDTEIEEKKQGKSSELNDQNKEVARNVVGFCINENGWNDGGEQGHVKECKLSDGGTGANDQVKEIDDDLKVEEKTGDMACEKQYQNETEQKQIETQQNQPSKGLSLPPRPQSKPCNTSPSQLAQILLQAKNSPRKQMMAQTKVFQNGSLNQHAIMFPFSGLVTGNNKQSDRGGSATVENRMDLTYTLRDKTQKIHRDSSSNAEKLLQAMSKTNKTYSNNCTDRQNINRNSNKDILLGSFNNVRHDLGAADSQSPLADILRNKTNKLMNKYGDSHNGLGGGLDKLLDNTSRINNVPDFSTPNCSKIEDYTMGNLIGRGAYAEVKESISKRTGERVAIKQYDRDKLQEAQRRKQALREIKILSRLDHPNIIKLHESIDTPRHVFLVMEYAAGESLHTHLKDQTHRQFREEKAKRIVKQLLLALEYIHDRNVTHRDIKLENIIIDRQEIIKLIDFGFCCSSQPETKLKIFCGTPSYMAPEIVQRKEYSGPPTDIWATGILFYAMLCGKFPFKGLDTKDLYRQIARGHYSFPDQSGLPEEYRVTTEARLFTQKMLVVNPQHRYSASQLINDPYLRGIFTRKDRSLTSDGFLSTNESSNIISQTLAAGGNIGHITSNNNPNNTTSSSSTTAPCHVGSTKLRAWHHQPYAYASKPYDSASLVTGNGAAPANSGAPKVMINVSGSSGERMNLGAVATGAESIYGGFGTGTASGSACGGLHSTLNCKGANCCNIISRPITQSKNLNQLYGQQETLHQFKRNNLHRKRQGNNASLSSLKNEDLSSGSGSGGFFSVHQKAAFLNANRGGLQTAGIMQQGIADIKDRAARTLNEIKKPNISDIKKRSENV